MLSIFVLLEDILGVKQTATCLRQNLSQASILAHYIYLYIKIPEGGRKHFFMYAKV